MERIFLIGFMGSGKTTLGKALAQKLGVDFIDLDLYIETRYHKTVREIFAESGEERFRQIEKSLLHEVADFENVIIAAGGGTPCFFDNIDYMNGHGTCVYLKASVEELCKRLAGGRESRPLLRGKSDEELRLFIDPKHSPEGNILYSCLLALRHRLAHDTQRNRRHGHQAATTTS